jgi:type IV fimbrial biogenesis protein FimT
MCIDSPVLDLLWPYVLVLYSLAMHEMDLLRGESRPSDRDGGFTLLEALVVLALIGVLAALAAPSVTGMRDRHQLQAQAEGLLSSLVLARSEALRRQQRVTLCPRTRDNACDASAAWQNGWLVFVDANDNAQREADEPLIEVHGDVPLTVRMGVASTVKGYFSYGSEGRSQSTGGAFMAGTWRFCQASAPVGWQVVSNALGKPRIEKYTPQTCP